ncbi:MAG: 50S ribosomal protein L3 [candidate division Zixibacteria bacterium]|nr:50S ribosomal protein L3 [candidate division Zixibacteria bacterium]
MKTLFGIKVGMTQVFDKAGNMVPVTVIKADPHSVLAVKTKETDGYNAVRVAFGEIRKKLVNKPTDGQFKKANLEARRYIRELNISPDVEYKVGDTLNVELFLPGERVRVTGVSKGLGFQGTVRRHGFAGGPKTHGQSDRLRAPGSIGQSSYPSRVWKGMKMSGHMGNEQVTVKNLKINSIEPEHNLILIRGAVPGKPGGLVKIVKA